MKEFFTKDNINTVYKFFRKSVYQQLKIDVENKLVRNIVDIMKQVYNDNKYSEVNYLDNPNDFLLLLNRLAIQTSVKDFINEFSEFRNNGDGSNGNNGNNGNSNVAFNGNVTKEDDMIIPPQFIDNIPDDVVQGKVDWNNAMDNKLNERKEFEIVKNPPPDFENMPPKFLTEEQQDMSTSLPPVTPIDPEESNKKLEELQKRYPSVSNSVKNSSPLRIETTPTSPSPTPEYHLLVQNEISDNNYPMENENLRFPSEISSGDFSIYEKSKNKKLNADIELQRILKEQANDITNLYSSNGNNSSKINVNGNLEYIVKKIYIDSTIHKGTLQIPKRAQIVSIELLKASIPKSEYLINEDSCQFTYTHNNFIEEITLEPGFYTLASLLKEMSDETIKFYISNRTNKIHVKLKDGKDSKESKHKKFELTFEDKLNEILGFKLKQYKSTKIIKAENPPNHDINNYVYMYIDIHSTDTDSSALDWCKEPVVKINLTDTKNGEICQYLPNKEYPDIITFDPPLIGYSDRLFNNIKFRKMNGEDYKFNNYNYSLEFKVTYL